jgi:hypothetical protein
VIPRWPIGLLVALYVVAISVVVCLGTFAPASLHILKGSPPAMKMLAMLGIVTAAAIGISLFILFYGYIWADAKRRGMSPLLWLVVTLLVPYLIGVILYFVVREPLRLNCPQCGRTLDPHFNFCPACQFNLRPTCPQCRRAAHPTDRFCPHCGFALQSDTVSQESAPNP